MNLVIATIVVAMPISSAHGEGPGSSEPDLRRAFEEWGEAWYQREGEKSEPAMFLRVTSSRAKSGSEKLPAAVIETRLATATGILVHRNNLSFDSSPEPLLLAVVDSTREDDVTRAFSVRFQPARVTSEVRICFGCPQSSRDDFAKAHAWELAVEGPVAHPDRVFKDVELMALGGIDARALTVLAGRELRKIEIRRVEDSEVEFEGKTHSARVFEASAPGVESGETFWVSRDLGLLQFRRTDGTLFRRVSAQTATEALLQAERKARGWDENMYPNPEAVALEIRIRLTTEDGETVKKVVSGREAADAKALEATLVEDVNAAKATGDSWVVIIDADPEIRWKETMAIMEVCKKNDITKVELAIPRPRK